MSSTQPSGHGNRTPSGQPLVVAEGIEKVLGDRVIAFGEPRVALYPGELVLIVGESGCGKSSLLRILALQDQSYRGTLTILGENVRGLSEEGLNRIRSDVLHYIPQKHLGLLGRSPVENIVTWLVRLDGFSRIEATCAAEIALERVGIERRQFHLKVGPPAFSGGQQARVALALALARRRPLCLADEVLAGLDWESAVRLFELLRLHLADCNGAVAVVWHLPDPRLEDQSLPFDRSVVVPRPS